MFILLQDISSCNCILFFGEALLLIAQDPLHSYFKLFSEEAILNLISH